MKALRLSLENAFDNAATHGQVAANEVAGGITIEVHDEGDGLAAIATMATHPRPDDGHGWDSGWPTPSPRREGGWC